MSGMVRFGVALQDAGERAGAALACDARDPSRAIEPFERDVMITRWWCRRVGRCVG